MTNNKSLSSQYNEDDELKRLQKLIEKKAGSNELVQPLSNDEYIKVLDEIMSRKFAIQQLLEQKGEDPSKMAWTEEPAEIRSMHDEMNHLEANYEKAIRDEEREDIARRGEELGQKIYTEFYCGESNYRGSENFEPVTQNEQVTILSRVRAFDPEYGNKLRDVQEKKDDGWTIFAYGKSHDMYIVGKWTKNPDNDRWQYVTHGVSAQEIRDLNKNFGQVPAGASASLKAPKPAAAVTPAFTSPTTPPPKPAPAPVAAPAVVKIDPKEEKIRQQWEDKEIWDLQEKYEELFKQEMRNRKHFSDEDRLLKDVLLKIQNERLAKLHIKAYEDAILNLKNIGRLSSPSGTGNNVRLSTHIADILEKRDQQNIKGCSNVILADILDAVKSAERKHGRFLNIEDYSFIPALRRDNINFADEAKAEALEREKFCTECAEIISLFQECDLATVVGPAFIDDYQIRNCVVGSRSVSGQTIFDILSSLRSFRMKEITDANDRKVKGVLELRYNSDAIKYLKKFKTNDEIIVELKRVRKEQNNERMKRDAFVKECLEIAELMEECGFMYVGFGVGLQGDEVKREIGNRDVTNETVFMLANFDSRCSNAQVLQHLKSFGTNAEIIAELKILKAQKLAEKQKLDTFVQECVDIVTLMEECDILHLWGGDKTAEIRNYIGQNPVINQTFFGVEKLKTHAVKNKNAFDSLKSLATNKEISDALNALKAKKVLEQQKRNEFVKECDEIIHLMDACDFLDILSFPADRVKGWAKGKIITTQTFFDVMGAADTGINKVEIARLRKLTSNADIAKELTETIVKMGEMVTRHQEIIRLMNTAGLMKTNTTDRVIETIIGKTVREEWPVKNEVECFWKIIGPLQVPNKDAPRMVTKLNFLGLKLRKKKNGPCVDILDEATFDRLRTECKDRASLIAALNNIILPVAHVAPPIPLATVAPHIPVATAAPAPAAKPATGPGTAGTKTKMKMKKAANAQPASAPSVATPPGPGAPKRKTKMKAGPRPVNPPPVSAVPPPASAPVNAPGSGATNLNPPVNAPLNVAPPPPASAPAPLTGSLPLTAPSAPPPASAPAPLTGSLPLTAPSAPPPPPPSAPLPGPNPKTPGRATTKLKSPNSKNTKLGPNTPFSIDVLKNRANGVLNLMQQAGLVVINMDAAKCKEVIEEVLLQSNKTKNEVQVFWDAFIELRQRTTGKKKVKRGVTTADDEKALEVSDSREMECLDLRDTCPDMKSLMEALHEMIDKGGVYTPPVTGSIPLTPPSAPLTGSVPLNPPASGSMPLTPPSAPVSGSMPLTPSSAPVSGSMPLTPPVTPPLSGSMPLTPPSAPVSGSIPLTPPSAPVSGSIPLTPPVPPVIAPSYSSVNYSDFGSLKKPEKVPSIAERLAYWQDTFKGGTLDLLAKSYIDTVPTIAPATPSLPQQQVQSAPASTQAGPSSNAGVNETMSA